jgi:antitoxin (DNA-binding transcriptional repressor) of toxin-antitoxin stability system
MIRTLPRGPVIITKNGRPCAALVSLPDGANLEAFLVAHHPRLTALIEHGMAQRGGATLEQVEREVARRGRKGVRRRKVASPR